MTGPNGRIEFQTEGIGQIAQQTMSQQGEWDRVWENCRGRINATAADALDRLTGSSLEERNAEYHRKSTLYSQNVGQQGQAVQQIGTIATDTNQQMKNIIRGGH